MKNFKSGKDEMPAEKVTLLIKLSESGYLGYVFCTFIVFLGGTVRYLKTLNKNQPVRFRDWIVEMVVSAFVAIMAGLVCAGLEVDYIWSFAIIGVTSHEGTRALYLIRNLIKKKIES